MSWGFGSSNDGGYSDAMAEESYDSANNYGGGYGSYDVGDGTVGTEAPAGSNSYGGSYNQFSGGGSDINASFRYARNEMKRRGGVLGDAVNLIEDAWRVNRNAPHFKEADFYNTTPAARDERTTTWTGGTGMLTNPVTPVEPLPEVLPLPKMVNDSGSFIDQPGTFPIEARPAVEPTGYGNLTDQEKAQQYLDIIMNNMRTGATSGPGGLGGVFSGFNRGWDGILQREGMFDGRGASQLYR